MGNPEAEKKYDTQYLNLKELEISKVRSEVKDLLVDGESIECAFHTVRDQVLFTNKRIIIINVTGIVGKRIIYLSYPYSRIQYFGIETAGVFDIDSEMVFAFTNGSMLQFDFKARVDIRAISKLVSKYVM